MFNWGNVGHIATEDKYLTPNELEDMILREMNICIYLFSFLKNGMVDYTLWQQGRGIPFLLE